MIACTKRTERNMSLRFYVGETQKHTAVLEDGDAISDWIEDGSSDLADWEVTAFATKATNRSVKFEMDVDYSQLLTLQTVNLPDGTTTTGRPISITADALGDSTSTDNWEIGTYEFDLLIRNLATNPDQVQIVRLATITIAPTGAEVSA